ncbi:hypothetical protein F2Q69_00048099 [Brassica cretica]|uniref:Uncharacterized protein n=1 Tax=Brassica cretica TaxID=69181 RepID=A0A8S9Q1L5_BRACR|nr:hypothetical protein F2Q69_00048099 [Brassica cretica]
MEQMIENKYKLFLGPSQKHNLSIERYWLNFNVGRMVMEAGFSRKLCKSSYQKNVNWVRRMHLGMLVLVKSSEEYFCMDASKTGINCLMKVISRICIDGCGNKEIAFNAENVVNQGYSDYWSAQSEKSGDQVD